jgi:hypothetical protein
MIGGNEEGGQCEIVDTTKMGNILINLVLI